MTIKDLPQLSDDELIKALSENRPSPIFDAFFIGFLIGIVIYGAAANALGFIFLIPLFIIYLFLKKPKKYRALIAEVKKRGLD